MAIFGSQVRDQKSISLPMASGSIVMQNGSPKFSNPVMECTSSAKAAMSAGSWWAAGGAEPPASKMSRAAAVIMPPGQMTGARSRLFPSRVLSSLSFGDMLSMVPPWPRLAPYGLKNGK